MKVHLSKREYRVLLEMLYVADLVLHDENEMRPEDAYFTLYQKVLSWAKDFGCEKWVEYDEATKEYDTSGLWEDEAGIHELLDDYDDRLFWRSLVLRLLNRDIDRMHTKEAFLNMSEEERFSVMKRTMDKYTEEFELHQLDRMRFGG